MISGSDYGILRGLIQTEKSSGYSEIGKYCFEVDKSFNKSRISSFVSEFFSVRVKKVNIVNAPSKTKRFKGRVGLRVGYKKAVVTLEKGDFINVQDLK